MINHFPGMRVVLEAGDGIGLLEKLAASADALPHVMLLNINLPAMDGVLTATEVIREYPAIKIIVFSSVSDSDPRL